MIEIKSNGMNKTKIYLDGKRVKGAYGVEFKAEVNEIPKLTISIYSLDENLKEAK